MTTLAEATAAPFNETIDGKEYTFSPLTFADWGAIEQTMRGLIIKAGVGALGHAETESDKALILDRAYMTAAKLSLSVHSLEDADASVASMRLFNAPSGRVQVLYQSLCQRHQQLTIADVSRLADKADDVGALIRRILTTSGICGDEGAKKNAGESSRL